MVTSLTAPKPMRPAVPGSGWMRAQTAQPHAAPLPNPPQPPNFAAASPRYTGAVDSGVRSDEGRLFRFMLQERREESKKRARDEGQVIGTDDDKDAALVWQHAIMSPHALFFPSNRAIRRSERLKKNKIKINRSERRIAFFF